MGETRTRNRFAILLIVASMFSCFVFGTETVCAENAANKKIVRIPCGINNLLYFDEDGAVTGSCKEYLDGLARINNWEYEYVEATWSEALVMLETGEIDILFPVSLTPGREDAMAASAMVGGYTAPGLFVREDSSYVYNDYESFDGARIAVTENSYNETALAEYAQEHHFSYEPVYIGTVEEKAKALADGTVDMLLFSAANEMPGTKLVAVFEAEPFYFTVKKGNTQLLNELNSGMQEMLTHETDLVTEMLTGALVGKNSGNYAAFTREEQQFITDGEEIIVGFYQNTEPLAYEDSNGEYKGIYIELLESLRERLNLNIRLYPISNDEYWQDLVMDGTIDFFMGASNAISIDEERFQVTSSFMEYEAFLITKNDSEVHGDSQLNIALTKTRSYWEADVMEDFENAEIIYYSTPKDCLLAVKSGEADATLLNTIEYNYQSKNSRFSDLIQRTNYRLRSGTAMTASKDVDPVMYSLMNKALGTLNDSEVSDIINANLNMAYENSDLSDYIYAARYFLILSGIILAGCVVICVMVYKFRGRQQKLEQETHEREKHQLRILAALSLDYSAIYYVNLDTDTYTIVKFSERMRKEIADMATRSEIFSETMQQYIDRFVLPEYQDTVDQLFRKDLLIERFQEEKDFVIRYQVRPNANNQDFFEMHLVDVSEKPEEHIMVLGFRCVDNIAKEEIAQKQALKEAFDAANSANHAKTDFLSKMSHDIRTPMNAIIGMTAIAAANIDDKERVQDALSKITSSSRHLLALINEVLDMSKIESGKIDLVEEEFNLSDLMNNLLAMVQPQIVEHGHHLDVHILNIEHEDVVGDTLRIQQVFINIMGNAIKYTPDNGNISLTVQEKAIHKGPYGCYEFVFEDDGIGMSEEFLEHIFEPFSRAEDVRISKIQGTGLGMAITQNIVRMMNGNIQIESEIGKGSRFTVDIFLKLQDTQDVAIEELAGLPVLVVDDEQIDCEATCQMLEEIGMEGEWVLSGREAVQKVESAHELDRDFYAVILDWKMPEMDGVETARAIRRVVGPEVPVIILSAYDWSEIEIEARAAGVDAFISKPVFKSKLIRLFKDLKTGAADEESVKHALDGVAGSSYSGRRALLVEDNELNREIGVEILEMTGMEVDTAENGKEAVDKIMASGNSYYDIVFMDVQMPVMNGYDATVAIRSLDRADASRMPIIAMTANAFAEDIQAAKTSGMNEHLAKPLDFDKLTEVLKKYLD